MIDHNWPRWIFASISKHFNDNRGTLPLVIEGMDHDSTRDKDWFELRVDGPYFKVCASNSYRLVVEVNCLITSAMDEYNFHRLYSNIGIITSLYTSIPVYKLGTGTDDSSTEQIGCLELLGRGNEAIRVVNYGQREAHKKIMQSAVDAFFYIDLTAPTT